MTFFKLKSRNNYQWKWNSINLYYNYKNSGSIIDLVIDHTISISKYNPLAESSYIKLPKTLDHPRKRLINIQNIDVNEPG